MKIALEFCYDEAASLETAMKACKEANIEVKLLPTPSPNGMPEYELSSDRESLIKFLNTNYDEDAAFLDEYGYE